MIDDGQVPFKELIAAVRNQERTWVRLGAALKDKTWRALALDVVAPVEPPGWEERTWRYPEARFHAFIEGGPKVAGWLEDGKATFDNDEVVIPGLPLEEPNAWVEAHGNASRQNWGLYEPLTWPTTFYELRQSSGDSYGPQKMLIAEGAPSFYRFLDAAITVFGLTSRMTQSVSQLPAPSVRIQNLTGRIARVVIHPTKVEVYLEGEALRGLIVELAGRVPGPQLKLSGANEAKDVSLDTPDGLPDEAWIVLKTGTTCVDRKFLNWRYSLSRDPDVEIVQEPLSVVEALVAAGEGPEIEFKEQLPTDPSGRRKVCRTLAAFANGHGGHLLFGVDDDGRIVGVSADGAGQCDKDTVTRWITDLVDPHLDFFLDIVETEDGLAVLYVEAQEGHCPPYGVDPANPSYYIRRGATTFPASAADVRALARARPLIPEPPAGLARLL
jgi:hypothetical protein